MKLINIKFFVYVLSVMSSIVGIVACTSSTELSKPFVGNKEITYPQRPDTVEGLSGYGRVVLKIVKPPDPRVIKAGVFWLNGTHSVITKFPAGKDTLRVTIDSLQAGTYSFNVYSYYKNTGKSRSIAKSVKTTVSAVVYGKLKRISLTKHNRAVTGLAQENGNAVIDFGSNYHGKAYSAIGTVVKYTDKSGKVDSVFVPADSSTIHINISNISDSNRLFHYYTLYQLPAAVNTFHTNTDEIKFIPNIITYPYEILGNYGAVIRDKMPDANGIHHVNTSATISKLKELHVNTYYYLIYHEKTDWSDLKNKFLPAAQKAGINVVAYLVPPSESKGTHKSYPYTTNYIEWAKTIANLSLRYPNLKGWAIDDFGYNLSTFTPDYVKQMTLAGKKINPKLSFKPVIYYPQITSKFVKEYSQYINGIIFPYKNFYDVEPLKSELDKITKLFHSKTIVLMVYVLKHSKVAFPPPVNYVLGALQTGLNYKANGKLAGVTTYFLSLSPQKESCAEDNYISFVLPPHTKTHPGNYVEASQKVQVNPSASSYQISFLQRDSFKKYPRDDGYHLKQLLVDGHVVWPGDVANDPADDWSKESFDLTSYLKDKSNATIAFRLYEHRGVSNFHIEVDIADIQAQGFNVVNPQFVNNKGWKISSNVSYMKGSFFHHQCDPNRQEDIYKGVKNLYGSEAGE
jgi:hypothetical protein